MRTLSLLLIALPAAAQIAPPRIGCFIDAQHRMRSIYGTAGNFIVSAPGREGALAALCAPGLTIVKTENAIEVNGTVLAAPPGPAWIAPDGLVCYANGECERFGAPGPAPRLEARLLQCRPEERQVLVLCRPEERPAAVQCQPEGPVPPCQPEGRKIIAHGASRGNAAKNESAPEGAEEKPGQFCSCGALPVLLTSDFSSARDDAGLMPPRADDKVRPPLPPVAAQIRISDYRRDRLESGSHHRTSEPGRDRREPWAGACTERPLRPCGAVLIAGRRCITLPPETGRVHYLGPGWLRIVLAGGGHMALSLERMALYILPEVMP